MNSFWSSILDKLLSYLGKVVPAVTAVGAIVYNFFMRKLLRKNIEINDLELKLKMEQNKDDVEKANAGKSAADIVGDAIREGERIRESNGEKPGSGQ